MRSISRSGIKQKRRISPSREIAYIAVTCALLIGGQYVFSFVAGVEIVTLLLVCFAYTFGVRRGVVLSVVFSLLRCIIYGIYPTVLILYLVYYPFLSAVFGMLGHIGEEGFKSFNWALAVMVNCLLLAVVVACAAVYCLDLIKISRLYKTTAYILLWIVFALSVGLSIAFNGLLIALKFFKKEVAAGLKLITVASVAAVCTIIFTLLDDVITPLFFGYTNLAWLAYFYASFPVMLTQTVCTIVSVCSLFLPLTSVMNRAANG